MQAPVPMIVFEGPRHVIRLVNPLWAASHDVVGRLLAEASPAAVEQGLVAMLDLVYRTGGPLKLTEHPFRFDDGAGTEEERFFDTSFQPTRDAAGNVTGIIAVGTEVTEQVLARRRIEEARVLLDTLLMNAPIGISVLDSNLRFIQVNEALARITGIPVHGHLGQTVSEIWGEDFGGAVEERLSQVLASGVPITDCEMSFPVRREAWDTQCFLTSYYPICIQGEITGVGALVQDITERRHAEAERARLLVREQAARTDAELANRLKDEFLARVSHELRTPLAAMKLWIHVLEAGRADDAPRAIEAVSEGVKAQSRMIEDLLDVARGMSGKLRLNLQPTELGKVVRAAVAAVRPEAAQRSILLSLRTENGPARIMADEARVNQIVSNLLSNALKFTPEGGSVAVVLTSDEGHARIRVSDSGQGITPDFLPHLFTPFRQGDGSNTRSHGGLGLGLSIVRQLVELHGGTVTAESPGEAKGATFTVSLPRTAMSVAASPSVTPPDSQWLRGLDVLLIEDDHPTRQGLALVLEKYGVHVRQAASAREAIEAYQTAPPSVILCDLSMPVEDGYSFIRKVRTLEGQGARRIPAAALTAHARAKDRLRALSAGFQAHIAKPVEVAELLAAVAKLSGRARAS
jgi:PAS domain S-box-containing protein